jgi:hypothetical protein
MTRFGAELTDLLDRYVCLERKIQSLISPLVLRYCAVCAGTCCRREICEESIESEFLALLVTRQKIRYDDRNGWLGPDGCRLEYGRPPVCYDFFCEDIMANKLFQASQIGKMTRDFASIGNKVYGNTHLICLTDLDVLTPKKIDRLCDNITALIQRVTQTAIRIDTL